MVFNVTVSSADRCLLWRDLQEQRQAVILLLSWGDGEAVITGFRLMFFYGDFHSREVACACVVSLSLCLYSDLDKAMQKQEADRQMERHTQGVTADE